MIKVSQLLLDKQYSLEIGADCFRLFVCTSDVGDEVMTNKGLSVTVSGGDGFQLIVTADKWGMLDAKELAYGLIDIGNKLLDKLPK